MMNIDQIRQMLIAANKQAEGKAEPSIESMRQGMLASTVDMPPAPTAKIEDANLGGIRAQKITPEKYGGARTLLYFHGGGYVLGAPETHTCLVSNLAVEMQADTWSADYRLAPEHPFPAAIEDGVAAYRGLLDKGVNPENIIIGGDSAGGGTSLASMLMARDQGLPMPAGLLLLSPWVNLTNTGWSYQTRAKTDPMIGKTEIDRMARLYLNGADPKTAYASPVFADLSGLPPMLIQVGPDEVLFSDSILLAERAGAAQNEVHLEIWPNMIHVFQAFHPFLQEAREAVSRLASWAREKTPQS